MTINMAEWVDIFLHERGQISTLHQLLDTEYKDPKVVDMLLALLEVVRHLTVKCMIVWVTREGPVVARWSTWVVMTWLGHLKTEKLCRMFLKIRE